ncbi:MAG: hypothetical protein SFX72_20815 [Isosphaeraceae bacterium]|nr:hypothetical protein [Isosphaeraceae bacterium]
MSTDAKNEASPPPEPKTPSRKERGILIFTYPKIIFIFPTLLIALICWVGMLVSGDHTEYTKKTAANEPVAAAPTAEGSTPAATHERFKSPQNMLAILFVIVFMFNILIIAIDFPRFTVVALGLFITTGVFFLLWLGIYVNWLSGLAVIFGGLYLSANATFYLCIALALGVVYAAIFISRWLDYWEILPNEILHHHGPWSDLERFPTMNLKFDKEVPDIFEHFMFGAGRLVLHLPSEKKSVVLDNVLHVAKKEDALKQLMSRLEVRVTTDQELGS